MSFIPTSNVLLQQECSTEILCVTRVYTFPTKKLYYQLHVIQISSCSEGSSIPKKHFTCKATHRVPVAGPARNPFPSLSRDRRSGPYKRVINSRHHQGKKQSTRLKDRSTVISSTNNLTSTEVNPTRVIPNFILRSVPVHNCNH